MIGIILYCIFCYLFEIGFAIAECKVDMDFGLCNLLFAPIFAPIDLGMSVYLLLKVFYNIKYETSSNII